MEIPEEILKISELLKTQDNRMTANPMFVVQEKTRIWGLDSDYSDDYQWINPDMDYCPPDEEELKWLNEREENYEDTGSWYKCYYRDEWFSVANTACFTEQGCKDYIKANGHNHKGELQIYVEGSFRNFEYQEVRNFLISLTDSK